MILWNLTQVMYVHTCTTFKSFLKQNLSLPQRGVFRRNFRLQLSKEKNGKCPKSARAGGWARLVLNE